MKILGMEVYPKCKSDEEYVESIRKMVARSRWMWILQCCYSVVYFALAGSFYYLFILRFAERAPEFAEGLPVGAQIGVAIGAFVGLLVAFGMHNILAAILFVKSSRTEVLMLQYHDELKRQQEARGSGQSRPPEP